MRHVSKPSGSVQHGTLWLCPAKEVVGDGRMRHAACVGRQPCGAALPAEA